MIDQTILCWLDVHNQQTMAAEPREGKSNIEFLDRRLEKSRRRCHAALESLARLDRILGLDGKVANS